MPDFIPSSVHSATAVFSNPKSAGFDYSASLCMGANRAEMAVASFHLDAGQSKAVVFSVTMPGNPGTYPVYFKVTSGGKVIGIFAATEIVVLVIAPTCYEYYTKSDEYSAMNIPYPVWGAQTFTPSIAHRITSVKLLLGRDGIYIGPVTVSIRATDVNGHPTGEDLCSGTTNGSTLPEYPTYEWREIALGNGYVLSAGIKYAIVVRALSSTTSNFIRWRTNSTNATYAGGNFEYGNPAYDEYFKYIIGSWTSNTTRDFMFEEWGVR